MRKDGNLCFNDEKNKKIEEIILNNGKNIASLDLLCPPQ